VTAKPKRPKYEKPNEAITSPPTTGIETALMPKNKSFRPKYLPLSDAGTISEIRAVDATVVAHHPRPIISIPISTMRWSVVIGMSRALSPATICPIMMV
jgi:hypothetical protein